MKVKYSIAVLGALFASSNGLRVSDDFYPFGSPYSTAELENTNKEVKDAWEMIEYHKNVAAVEEQKKKAENDKENELEAKWIEMQMDITHPSHIQGRKYEIVEDNLIQQRAEPPSKNAGSTEEPTLGEDEGKTKELADANAASAKL